MPQNSIRRARQLCFVRHACVCSRACVRARAPIASPVLPLNPLQKLAWNGIPHNYRSSAWKIMLGFMPAQEQRREVGMCCETLNPKP